MAKVRAVRRPQRLVRRAMGQPQRLARHLLRAEQGVPQQLHWPRRLRLARPEQGRDGRRRVPDGRLGLRRDLPLRRGLVRRLVRHGRRGGVASLAAGRVCH